MGHNKVKVLEHEANITPYYICQPSATQMSILVYGVWSGLSSKSKES